MSGSITDHSASVITKAHMDGECRLPAEFHAIGHQRLCRMVPNGRIEAQVAVYVIPSRQNRGRDMNEPAARFPRRTASHIGRQTDRAR